MLGELPLIAKETMILFVLPNFSSASTLLDEANKAQQRIIDNDQLSSTIWMAPDNVPDIPDALNAEELEPGLLYAVLTYRGELASWNWAFFVADPDKKPIGTSGTIFHVVDNDSVGEWKFEVESRDIISSPLVVAILRLADVGFLGGYADVVGADSLMPMFKTVAIPSTKSTSFSSRTWFLEAICVLHDCGVVQCDDVWLLEREIRRCAFTAMDKYLENKGCLIFLFPFFIISIFSSTQLTTVI